MATKRPAPRSSFSSASGVPHDDDVTHRLLPPPGHHGRVLKKDAPVYLKKRSSKWFILVTICVALFTDSFIYGVLVPVVPFLLKDRCGVPSDQEQLWTSALFALFGAAILIGSPICGYIADHTTARRPALILGLPLLILSVILLGFATTVPLLLISRLLAGASTAITWTVGLALTVDTVGRDEVGQWMGTAISSNSIGLVVSPLLGGIVYARVGLNGVLGMVGALVVVNTLLIGLLVEKGTAEKWYEDSQPGNGAANGKKTKAVQGSSVSNNGYDTFTNGHANGNSSRSTHFNGQAHGDAHNHKGDAHHAPLIPTDSAAAAAQASSHPHMPPLLRILFSPRILASSYGVFTQFGLLASFDAFLPLFVKRRFGWGSLGAGLIFLNIAIPALAGPIAGKISDRYGPRRVALAGCILTTPPLVLLRIVGFEETPGQVVLLCGLLVLIGLFLTLIISPLAADLSYAVDAMEAAQPGIFGPAGAYAQAYALFNCAMAAAEVVGPILAGAVQDRYGMKTVAWVLGVWCASAIVPVLLFIGDDVAPKYKVLATAPDEEADEALEREEDTMR